MIISKSSILISKSSIVITSGTSVVLVEWNPLIFNIILSSEENYLMIDRVIILL